jgi:hypothetical protein
LALFGKWSSKQALTALAIDLGKSILAFFEKISKDCSTLRDSSQEKQMNNFLVIVFLLFCCKNYFHVLNSFRKRNQNGGG